MNHSKLRHRRRRAFEHLEKRDLLTGFTAYNAIYSGTAASPFTTRYADAAGSDAAGPLRDVETGEYVAASVVVSAQGVTYGGQGAAPHPDTDAGLMFDGFVDFSGSDRRTIELNSTDVYQYTFEQLDPGALYDFAGTAVRGNPLYTNRWTLVQIEGAASFDHAHSAGAGILREGLADNQVVFWGGHNTLDTQGFVVQWQNIDPGPDGEFTITAQQYRGAIPTSVHASGVADGNKGYGLSAIRIIEQTPEGPPVMVDYEATEITASSALLTGNVETTGGQLPDITVYYGTADGGTNVEAWQHSISLPASRNYTQPIDGLLAGTTYFYRSFGENQFGVDWADVSQSFTTLIASPPVISTLPATQIGGVTGTLVGNVDSTGNDPPVVTLFYGTNDGGTDPLRWQSAVELGVRSDRIESVVDSLSERTEYHFNFRARNSMGEDWGTTQTFTTSEVPPLLISEFMADNADTYTTRVRSGANEPFVGDLRTPDWIEIRNTENVTASLTGYYLTDDLSAPQKWQFPDGTRIAGNGYLLVFASGFNLLDPALDERGLLHTSFQLSTGAGSELALVGPDGLPVASLTDLPGQFEDVSYGLSEEGLPRYFATPTPGQANSTNSPPAPHISLASRTFTDSVTVELTAASESHTIHYTTDESRPSVASPVYDGPLEFTRSTNLRAIAVASNGESSVVVGESYLRFAPSVADDESHLPLLIVETFGDSISSTSFGENFVAIIEPGADGISRPSDPFDLATRAGLKIRGSSSSGFSKKQYRVEFRDEQDEDRKLNVLGMPSEADWIFYGPSQYDRNLIANPLMYDLSNQIGRYAVRTRWTEAYFNGRYYGVYAMMEVIERDDDRVDVEPLTSGSGGQPVEGGFLWKNDRGSAYVDPEILNTKQRAYVDGQINALRTAAASANFKDPHRGYAAYADVDSFVDHNLLNLLAMNVDALRLSSYYFKTADGKLEAGPIWDFDRSLDSTDGRDNNARSWYGTGDSTRYFNDSDRVMSWWPDMFQDPDFVQRYIDRWFELRSTTWSDENLKATIDKHAAILGDAALRDYARWSPSRYSNFAGEINHLKTWLQSRVDWIDSRWQDAPESDAASDRVPPGTMVNIAAGTGTIYYTLDGSDPRGPAGTIQTNALIVDGRIRIEADSKLFARRYQSGFGGSNGYIRSGDDWSAPLRIEALHRPATAANLAISEIHFNPAAADVLAGEKNDDNDEFEFLELQNIADEPIELEGVRLVEVDVDGKAEGVEFTFDAQTLLPGEALVVVENVEAFRSRYGESVRIALGRDQADDVPGQYSGKLDNGGERLTLLDATGDVIRQFDFQDWYAETDGQGYSLVNNLPQESRGFLLGQASTWHPSSHLHGAPGVRDVLPGDLDGSGTVDSQDIDSLFASLAAADPPTRFDLNQDGGVDLHDLNLLVEGVLNTRRGDLNLDGKVNFADFLTLSANFGKQNEGWQGGDFDGDGKVAFADFLLLSTNFGFDNEA